jgi:hypothetical protein
LAVDRVTVVVFVGGFWVFGYSDGFCSAWAGGRFGGDFGGGGDFSL